MTAIFISHNSNDAKEASALKRWLADNGWDDVFLDIDAKDGLSPGARWKDALRIAADRCEAVLCLVSPTWLASAECKLEFRYAEQLHKHLFLAIIKPCDPEDLPPDWQWCPLYGDGAKTTVSFEFREQPAECAFLSHGLERLKNGLEKAGISAEHFPWPPANDPDRAPYRGLKPLEAADAAVFFGRNAQTLHGMETLWDMRRNGLERLLVILGASGSGKSSFMRAGLLPRLARDERQFFPLSVIRPRNAVLWGAEGLAPALAAAFAGLGRHLTLGAIEQELKAGPEAFKALLAHLEQWLLQQRPLEPLADEVEPLPPTLVLPIDQAEELFNPDGAVEAAPFLELLGGLLTDRSEPGMSAGAQRRALVVLTMRSDRYERLQTASGLSEIKPRLFDLRPFPPSQLERVINGPAERATQAGRRLTIEPRLTERLLADFSAGADTLPLLGFALEKLYHKYGTDGDLTLEEYEAIRGSHETVQAAIFQEAIDSALAEPYRPPPIPAERAEQYQGMRRAFIPYLARINPETNEPLRQVAHMRDLPSDVRPLVERLVEARLLIRDKDAIEVTHESLLRQWPSLRGWLTEDHDKLRLLENIRQSAAEWHEEYQRDDLLVHRDGRLKDAEALLATPGYVVSADSDERAYLNACTAAQQAREQERAERAEAERIAQERELEQAKALAEAQRQRADEQAAARIRQRRFSWGLVALLALAVGTAFYALQQRDRARRQTVVALLGRMTAQAELLRARGGPVDASVMLAAEALARLAALGEPRAAADFALRSALASLPRTVREFDFPARRYQLDPSGRILVMRDPTVDTLGAYEMPDGRFRSCDASGIAAATGPAGIVAAPRQVVALSANGLWCVTRHRSDTAATAFELWSAEPLQRVASWVEHGEVAPTLVAVSDDGHWLAATRPDAARRAAASSLRLWNRSIGNEALRLQGAGFLGFAPDGRTFATTEGLWQLPAEPGAPANRLWRWKGVPQACVFSPAGDYVAIRMESEGAVESWSLATAEVASELRPPRGTLVALGDGGRAVVIVGQSETLLWDAWTDRERLRLLQAAEAAALDATDLIALVQDVGPTGLTRQRLVRLPVQGAAYAMARLPDGLDAQSVEALGADRGELHLTIRGEPAPTLLRWAPGPGHWVPEGGATQGPSPVAPDRRNGGTAEHRGRTLPPPAAAAGPLRIRIDKDRVIVLDAAGETAQIDVPVGLRLASVARDGRVLATLDMSDIAALHHTAPAELIAQVCERHPRPLPDALRRLLPADAAATDVCGRVPTPPTPR